MGSSGIIYAILIGMWALYFIPRWLKRHEELSASRSVAKFDHAMRVLSRKGPSPDRSYVVMPRRPAAPRTTVAARPPRGEVRARLTTPITTSTSASATAATTRSWPPGRGAAPAVAATAQSPRRPASAAARRVSAAAMRRRRVLAGLLLGTVLIGLLTPLTPIPWWVPTLLLLVTVGDLVHLRVQVRTGREVDRTRAAVRRSVRSRLTRFDALDRLMSVRRELAEERAAEDARWQAAEEAERLEREAESAREAAAAAGWSPVPVPLPTYVSKPMAPRRTGPIDLTRPGVWSEALASGQQPFDQQDTVEGAPARSVDAMAALVDDAEVADDQLDAILVRRAVND